MVRQRNLESILDVQELQCENTSFVQISFSVLNVALEQVHLQLICVRLNSMQACIRRQDLFFLLFVGFFNVYTNVQSFAANSWNFLGRKFTTWRSDFSPPSPFLKIKDYLKNDIPLLSAVEFQMILGESLLLILLPNPKTHLVVCNWYIHIYN